MGSDDGQDDEKPVHKVYLDAFYIDKYEVTNAQYKKFIDATGYKPPENWNDAKVSESQADFSAPNKPVVGVSWEDAQAYCRWAGKRLPTEAEWEKSARGGLAEKKYPLGDDISHDKANYRGTDGKDSFSVTSPAGSFKPNGYGLYDMSGNVYEWCADLYNHNYYGDSPEKNPAGPLKGAERVLRGGSYNLTSYGLRASARNSALQSMKSPELGFRCVKSTSEQR
jgi:formylglycine-generating enzyme required for sulfatase activity